jgi:hypothetical protein
MLGKAQAISEQPYQVYGGPQTAGESGLQSKVFQGLGNLSFPVQLGQTFSSTGAYQPPGMTPGIYNTQPVGMGAGAPPAGGMGAPMGGQSSGQTGVAAQYMNPYLQLALNPQIRQATENARINSVAQDRGSARAGSYGGARNILAQQQANKNLQTNLSDIVGKGYNTAYENAMKTQFSQAQGLTDTATRATGANLANLQAQGAYGDLQRGIQQQQLDTQYSDVMRKQDFPMEQVGNMANILRGVPIIQTGGQTVTQTPPPSFASQLTGGLQAMYGLNQLSRI